MTRGTRLAGDGPEVAVVPVQTGEQVAALAALADEIWHECYAEILPAEQIDYMVGLFLSAGAVTAQMRDEGMLYYLLQFADGPGGFAALQPRGGRLLLSKLYLQSRRRGGGFGRRVLAWAEETGRQLGCHTIWLTVNRHNSRAAAVYRAAGYTCTGSQQADIGGGYVMDDYLYEKPL